MLPHFFYFHLNNTFLHSQLTCLTQHLVYSNHHTCAFLFLDMLTTSAYTAHNCHEDQINVNSFLHTYFQRTMFPVIQDIEVLVADSVLCGHTHLHQSQVYYYPKIRNYHPIHD